MKNFNISEEALHYAAAFLERWEEKAPNEKHGKASRELRELSNHLLDNMYAPMFVNIIRHNKIK